MPSGWSEYDLAARANEAGTKIGGELAVTDDPYPVVAKAARAFEQGQQTAFIPIGYVSNTVKLLQNEADAQRLLEDFRAASATKEWTESSEQGSYTVKLAALAFDKLGDETFAVRLNNHFTDPDTGSSQDAQVDYVVYRVGRIVSYLFMTLADSSALGRKSVARVDAYASGHP